MKTISKEGLDFLTGLEGLILHPYLDTQKVPTIGIGATYYEDGTRVTMKDPVITKARAYELFILIKGRYEDAINKSITVELTQKQFDALFCLCYNIGAKGFSGSTLVKRINAKASKQNIILAWKMWTKQKVLISRREKEIKYYFA